jgi:dephospho-CoA kinase
MADRIVIGLTGAFGSGCTTAALHLKHHRHFNLIKLSEPIKEEWKRLNPTTTPTREDLQRLGDDLREQHGTGVLIERAFKEFKKNNPKHETEVWAVDGIRNLGEVEFLRK